MVDESEMPCMGVYEVPLDELEELPTLSQGQADDLKIETTDENGRAIERVWLSRCTVDDGEPWDNKVSVEHNIDGRWTVVELWEAE